VTARTLRLYLPALLVLGSCSGAHRGTGRARTLPPASRPVVAAPTSRPAPRPRGPRFWRFETATGALTEVLKLSPRVLGIGEYHQKTGSAKVQSPLKRFISQMLEYLSDQSSDLVLELMLPEGDCGGKEDKVARKVEKTTERPEATENEAVTLLLRAKRFGVRPSIITLACKDYNELLGGDEIDYDRLLTIITEKLLAKAKEALSRPVRLDSLGLLRGRILIYGGALHNDLYPAPEYKAYSFAAALQKLTKGRYVELDLYVPEYIDGDAELAKQAWYPIFKREAGKDHVVLIERGRASYILILQRALQP
jgi:hypothetical protein